MERKPVVPAFPLPGLLPWLLAGLSLALLVVGIVTDNHGSEVIGGTGLGAVIVMYPLSRLLLGKPPEEPVAPPREPPDHL